LRHAVSLNDVFFAAMHDGVDDVGPRVTNASVPSQRASTQRVEIQNGSELLQDEEQEVTMKSILSAIRQQQHAITALQQRIPNVQGSSAATNDATHDDVLNAMLSPSHLPHRPAPPIPSSSAGIALSAPGVTGPKEDMDDDLSLDSLGMVYRPWLWHSRADDDYKRHMLLTTLRGHFQTGIQKLDHQVKHLLDVVDLLLQENIEQVYDLINDRLHFLLSMKTKPLDEAAAFYESLRGEGMKTSKFRNAEVTSAMRAKHRQGGGYTDKEHLFFTQHRGRTQDSHPGPPPPRATSATNRPTNPFIENQGGGQQGGGHGAGRRRGRGRWRRQK